MPLLSAATTTSRSPGRKLVSPFGKMSFAPRVSEASSTPFLIFSSRSGSPRCGVC